MNTVNIVGRLSADPELRSTQSGKNVLSFTVAVRRDKENTDWINCIAWEKTAELISNYFQKGSEIGITGRIQTSSFEDKQGNKRKTTDVIVNQITFIGSKSEAKPTNTKSTDTAPTEISDEPIDLSEIPF